MLILNEKNLKKAITMKEVIDAIDQTYELYESNDFQMPTRMQVKDKDNTLLLMPSVAGDTIGTKLVTIFPHNTNHPTLNGLVILNSNETGQVKGILDGTFLTGMRTGAIGGSAVRHLAKEDAHKLAIIGTGAQGLYQAIAACTERDITDIYLYNRTPEKISAFKQSLQNWIGNDIQLHASDTVEQAIKDADIIMTATTSHDPVLPNQSSLLENKLIIGVGSFQPSMREFPKSLYSLTNQILVDTDHAIEESGDLVTPLENGWITKENIQTMSSYLSICTEKQIRTGTIIFKSTGMALFDVVVARSMCQKAEEMGIGAELDF